MSAIIRYRWPHRSNRGFTNEKITTLDCLASAWRGAPSGYRRCLPVVCWGWELGRRAGRGKDCNKTGIIAHISAKGGGEAFATAPRGKRKHPAQEDGKSNGKGQGMHCLTGNLGLRLRPPKCIGLGQEGQDEAKICGPRRGRSVCVPEEGQSAARGGGGENKELDSCRGRQSRGK